MSEIIGMFGAITGDTQDSIGMIDIPQDGFIIGVDWDLNVEFSATQVVQAELSFIASNQLNTNDVRGRISSISARSRVFTSVGIYATSLQKWLGSFDIAVAGGERMFLHVVSSTGLMGSVRANLYVDLGTTTRRSARRR